MHGIIIPTFATLGTQSGEEAAVGDGREEGPDGGERRIVLETIPSEEGFGDGDVDWWSPRGHGAGSSCGGILQRSSSPLRGAAGRKILEKCGTAGAGGQTAGIRGGRGFPFVTPTQEIMRVPKIATGSPDYPAP
jgi:hypothetical protein